MSKIVIALGGNALGNNPLEQKELVKIPAEKIAFLVGKGHQVVVGHGNGPQVGMIFNAFQDAKKINEKTANVPLPESGGMSQGYIGIHMLTAITNEFRKSGIKKEPVYFLTQTIVDKNDKAFNNPTKPVGPFYKTEEEAIKANPNSKIIEDAGRGYRKVVASPIPQNFIGIETIKQNVENGNTIIVGGGGGIPSIINDNKSVECVDGVIDKDFALSKIASLVDADKFIVLTAVDRVYVNWGKPDQKALETVDVETLEKYILENQFAPGSMLPKVQACIEFVKSGKNREAIIADLTKIEDALVGASGTKIVNKL